MTARDYVLESHPDKLEVFDTCEKLSDMETEHYWCFFNDGKLAEDLYAEETTPFIGVFTKKQNGYKLADTKIPYPTEEELVEAVIERAHRAFIEFHIEDLKKTKWQLLAEAYINAK